MDPLHERSANTTSPTKSSSSSSKLSEQSQPNNSLDHHRQVLQSKLGENQGQKTYISPSDTILSPTTQKLSDLKGRRFAAHGASTTSRKGSSLFAKAVTAGHGGGGSSPEKAPAGFDDVRTA